MSATPVPTAITSPPSSASPASTVPTATPEPNRVQALTEGLFTYLPAWNVLICRQHEYGVRFNEANTHLLREHELALNTRKEITQYIKDHYSGTVNIPTERIDRISELPVCQGVRCRHCSYICQTSEGMVKHLKKKHDWTNPVKRGGNRREPAAKKGSAKKPAAETLPTDWDLNITYQQFFTHG